MKEMLSSKFMIVFIVLVLSVVYTSTPSSKMEEVEDEKTVISMNVM